MIQIEVCDMRGAGKAGYVAKLEGRDRNFLIAASYSDHGSSAKQVKYEIAEDAYGIYEICDANYGNRKRDIQFLAVAVHGFDTFFTRKKAETFAAKVKSAAAPAIPATSPLPAPVEAAPQYPGLKPAAEREEAPESFDIQISTCKYKEVPHLAVKMISDSAFKFFMPDMKNRVHGRIWNASIKSWLIPCDGAATLLLREIIEERTIRTNGIRTAMKFKISGKAKAEMLID